MYRLLLFSIIAVLSFCLVVSVSASDSWEDFFPPPDDTYDWIQLDSGEWLKGDIKAVYSDKFEFDSDKLGLLKLDFDDVVRLRTAGSKRIKLETSVDVAEVLTGKLVINDNSVQLINDNESVSLNRNEIVSIAEDAKRERDNWLGSISLGATMRGGNTKSMDMTTIADLKRNSATTRFSLYYIGNYSESRYGGIDGDSEETADNQRLNSYLEWLYSSRYYWRIIEAEYYRDPFSNIGNQYSLSSSIGYDMIRNSLTEWSINGGLGYQETIFDNPLESADEDAVSPFVRVGTTLDHEFSDRLDLLYDYSARFLSEENGRYTHHMKTTLSIDLYNAFDLDISLIWDRIENTTPIERTDSTGATEVTVPKQDDYQMVFGIAYDF